MDITNCSLEFKRSFTGLLKVKETQIRMSIIDQAMNAIDRGIHSGGAMSAVTPLITLYYGGFIKYDVQNPTKREQDYFVLSKGHATATMTSIYADLGYFSTELLKNTRAYYSIVNGHPGPILPGVHVSTGPLGEGICVAQGLAIAGMIDGIFDVFTMTGDGELQEGMAWESIIYAGQHGLSNLCVLVDNNSGQLDTYDRLLYPSDAHLAEQFESFNWNALEVDANSFDGLLNTLSAFKYGNRNGRPTAIICKSRKGVGGFSALFNKHKISMDEQLYANEMELQKKLLKKRENHLMDQMADLSDDERHKLIHLAVEMNIQIECKQDKKILHVAPKVKITKAPVRNKRIQYDGMQLPEIDKNKKYMCCDIIRESMKVFALDERVVSIDSDLGSTSGLEPGISFVDKYRAINVGIAEANMMNIGEAFSLLGYNVWVSTFCPFFNWQVMRRIAVSHQERCEDISNPDGWLNEGHGLDLTFLATASNIDTAVNGATHMGTDDILVFDTIPYLKIIDVSCPQQLLGIMKWIMEGNKGLVYLRIMRAGSNVIYDDDFVFEYKKGYMVKSEGNVVLVSSGRGVHECMHASEILAEKGKKIAVLDLPSFDGDILMQLYKEGSVLIFAEQNNGYLINRFVKYSAMKGTTLLPDQIDWVNLSDSSGEPRFIHSGTYDEITMYNGLDAWSLTKICSKHIK